MVRFLTDYIVLPEQCALVVAAWVLAAWLADLWDRFPHLAITSPEKRCGKTTLLDLLLLLVPRPRPTVNISPAGLYRLIEQEMPTLLMDESQSISRRGSEASEVVREMLNAGIGRNAKVIRCGGEGRDQLQEFSIYCPKVFALIGALDGVLADRSLPVPLKRKTREDRVQRYRSRVVEPRGQELRGRLERWAKARRKAVAAVYDALEPFDIDNDRMAELLMPLQAVVTVAGGDGGLDVLGRYARGLDERDREQEAQSPGVRLLAACREVFDGWSFLPTGNLIQRLAERSEEPWSRYTRGELITPEALAGLLRQFDIKSQFNKERTARGYYKHRFAEAWRRYLPPAAPSGKPSGPSSPSKASELSPLAARLAAQAAAKGGRA